jgi:hypothetical protein
MDLDGDPFLGARVFEPAGPPADRGRGHAVPIGEDPAHPQRCGLLELGDSDRHAYEVLGTFDAAVGPDVDSGVSERP